ncbi:chemotaxis protein CheD [Bdellovibrio sp. NC01]|uniref:chemotaxis protein CheD n=1 Tax=Bdellovibrio sp. NC01 TaxID=2220073 RepID=UPI00115B8AF1|nr:chemotaxis protein CheD [Bdellovibrio sp. NC01]QDK38670.1 chemotaxis protein CheD [Bdellovibrio sp. NC01]
MKLEEHHVKIGQIKVGTEGHILKAVLGSCVGIALIWKKQGKCALAHCLLPYPCNDKTGTDARYVTETLPRMLEQLGATKADYSDIRAVICGGSQMMEVEQQYTKFTVGPENLKIAQKCLQDQRIEIIAIEPGGNKGTKITVDCGAGSFEVERLKKIAA